VCGVSWQVVGSYGFDVSCLGKPPHTVIGYRALAVDYSENSRFGKDGLDMVQHGPMMGVSFRWHARPFRRSVGGTYMRVIVTTLKGVFAVAAWLLFIDDTKAGPVQLESDAGVITVIATIEAVDVTNQLVTVVGPHNNWVVVKVGPEHIKVVKIKEKITISYADEVPVALRKYDGPPETDGRQFVEQAEAGMDMNAPTMAEQDWVEATPHFATEHTTIEISDTISAINRHKRTITFAGTGGKTRTIAIGPDVQGFDQVEVGDRVVLLVTRAVAVDIRPV
jgi:hypothetical protein